MHYTKGKWFSCCKDSTPHFLFSQEGEVTICRFYQKQDGGTDIPVEEVRANALIIEKAPEMLELLTDLLSLKRYKDLHGKTPYYIEEMPKSWEKVEQIIKEATELKSE